MVTWRKIEIELVDILERRCGLKIKTYQGRKWIVDDDNIQLCAIDEIARELADRLPQ